MGYPEHIKVIIRLSFTFFGRLGNYLVNMLNYDYAPSNNLVYLISSVRVSGSKFK
jgi:hypothetical protein